MFSSNTGLAFVREDMGLERGDHLLIDPSFNEEELAILNMEVTPEIEHILNVALYTSAMNDLSDWENRRAVEDKTDWERILNDLVNVQEEMSCTMKEIQTTNKLRNEALEELNSWINRFNTWKASEAYKAYKNKNSAYQVFFKGLDDRKENYHTNKEKVATLWDKWNTLKDEASKIVGEDTWLWGQFFALADEELSRFFTTGETEEVDDYSRLTKNQTDVIDMIQENDILFNKEFEKPELSKNGFWNYKEEFKAYRIAKAKQDEADYLDSLCAVA